MFIRPSLFLHFLRTYCSFFLVINYWDMQLGQLLSHFNIKKRVLNKGYVTIRWPFCPILYLSFYLFFYFSHVLNLTCYLVHLHMDFGASYFDHFIHENLNSSVLSFYLFLVLRNSIAYSFLFLSICHHILNFPILLTVSAKFRRAWFVIIYPHYRYFTLYGTPG